VVRWSVVGRIHAGCPGRRGGGVCMTHCIEHESRSTCSGVEESRDPGGQYVRGTCPYG